MNKMMPPQDLRVQVEAARRTVLQAQEKYEQMDSSRQQEKYEDENIITRFRQVLLFPLLPIAARASNISALFATCKYVNHVFVCVHENNCSSMLQITKPC
jgi:hypothetical protein